jgi:hypothetical protein
MVPSQQKGLEEDRECADLRTGAPPPLSSATEPNPYGEVHPHLDLCFPTYIRWTRAISTRQETI